MTEELRERLEKMRLELGGVEIPQMRGDNLATTLATVFDDPYELDENEHGWGPSAMKGCDDTLDAIHAHYAPLVSEVERLEKERKLIAWHWRNLVAARGTENEEAESEAFWAMHDLLQAGER